MCCLSLNFVEILFLVCLSAVYRGEFKSVSEDGDMNGSGKYHTSIMMNYVHYEPWILHGFHLNVVSANLARVREICPLSWYN